MLGKRFFLLLIELPAAASDEGQRGGSMSDSGGENGSLSRQCL